LETDAVNLFDAVPVEQMRAAQVVTGLTMAAFIMTGFIPGARRRVRTIRLMLLVAYLLACCGFVAYALLG
jgi:hypothetical protein